MTYADLDLVIDHLPVMQSVAWIPILMAASYVASKVGKGKQDQRAAQNAAALQQDQLNVQRDRTALDRAQLEMDAPRRLARQALLGSLLKNAQGVSVTPPSGIRMGTVSGGPNLSALLSPNARAAGAGLEAGALASMLKGSVVPGASPMSTYQQPGKTETIASILGLLGSAYGAYKANGGGTGKEMDQVSKAGFGLGGY